MRCPHSRIPCEANNSADSDFYLRVGAFDILLDFSCTDKPAAAETIVSVKPNRV